MITPSAIRDVVSREDDFGHEMRVGHAIRSVPAIEVRHGGTYTDSVTGKPRQFDYRCVLRKEILCLSLAVECKNLTPVVPLVICGRKRQENESFHELIESRRGGFPRGPTSPEIVFGQSSVTRRAIKEDSIYRPGNFVGKSLLRIQSDKKPMTASNDSDVYEKWAQALSSAVELADSACQLTERFKSDKVFASILPVVVVPDDLLWRVVYDEKGAITTDPEKVNEAEFYIGRQIKVGLREIPQRFYFSHVHFFTLNGFQSFLSKMAVNDRAWHELFTPKAVEV
jgi:hypothetical protein